MKKDSVFITGSSLVCFLGKSKKQIVKNVKKLDGKEYEKRIKKAYKRGKLYKIDGFSQSPTKKFYDVLTHCVKKAVKEADLTKDEQKELAIFIGSTSMKISADEERLTHLGYKIIGEFVQDLVGSKKDFFILSTACTSSANAFCYASKMLEQKRIKKALVIGLEFFNNTTKKGFESFMLLSKSNIYRPFDKRSDGIILGEGCSAVVLESERKKEDDFKYLGSSNICDNYSETTSNTDGVAIYECLSESLRDSNLNLADIDIIKAHGTGSENNNEAEARGLELFLGEKKTNISALKPYLGHTLGACGTNEIVLMLACIKDGFVPKVAGFRKNKSLKFPLLKKRMRVKKRVNILFNFIGFSGNNTSIMLGNR